MNRCIDAGRDGCPCALAESGDCLICSKLAGGSCDDCGWQGTCIYTLYEQNGRQLADDRRSHLLKVVETRTYGPRFNVFILQADRGFCQKASSAGAYVFVKNPDDDPAYSTPISILKSEPDKGLIHLGICGCGPKSAKLLSQKSVLSVRGIYRNGLSGLSRLHSYPDETWVFAKGIAIAPLRNLLDGGRRYIKYLKNLRLAIDLDKVGFDFFKDYFGDLPAETIRICNFAREDVCTTDCLRPAGELEKINIFALTSPYYAEQIVAAAGTHAGIVRPVEGNFCCGEGICGACTYNDAKGNTIRRCKCAE